MSVKPFRDDLSWKWKPMAGRFLLVTDGGGEQVILSASYHAKITTRDLESGVLRDISPSDLVAKIIANAPDVRRHAQDLINGVNLGLIRIEPAGVGDRPAMERVLESLIVALNKSGAA